MDSMLWARVEEYVDGLLIPKDAALEAALQEGVRAGLPQIQVTADQGKLLYLLSLAIGARHVLEIGTLAGYSTIWLGRSVGAGGHVISLEANPRHAEIARANLARAGLAEVVEVREGLAEDLLASLAREGREPFDFVFIDANKECNPDYVKAALGLSHTGTLIVVDNVVRGGRILDGNADSDAQGVRSMFELIAGEPRLEGTAIQTVGSKGYDGFALLRVR